MQKKLCFQIPKQGFYHSPFGQQIDECFEGLGIFDTSDETWILLINIIKYIV